MTKASRGACWRNGCSLGFAVSVKCRIGVHERLLPDGTVPEDQRQLYNFIDEVSGGGATSHVMYTPGQRPRRLSPSKNRCIPPLRPTTYSVSPTTLTSSSQSTAGWRWMVRGVTRSMRQLRPRWRAKDRWCHVRARCAAPAAASMVPATRPATQRLRGSSSKSAAATGRPTGRGVNGRSSRSDAIERYTRYACLQVARQQASARDVRVSR